MSELTLLVFSVELPKPSQSSASSEGPTLVSKPFSLEGLF